MARINLDGWIPEERGSAVLETVNQVSAVELLATREPMTTDAKIIQRVGGVSVHVTGKGEAYTESTTADDEVTLKARKFTGLLRFAEEDLADIPANVIAIKQKEWAKSYAVKLDNAVLGVTAAETGDETAPFTSVYRALSQANAETGYVANANIIQTAGAVTYDDLSDVLARVEQGNRFGELVIIANPAFKAALRGVKDDNGAPVFVQGLAGTPDTMFGYQLAWSAGARTSATASSTPTGNPLLVVTSKESLILGVRSGPETFVADGNAGASMLTDEALVKMRARRAFVLGHEDAAAILEITAGV